MESYCAYKVIFLDFCCRLPMQCDWDICAVETNTTCVSTYVYPREHLPECDGETWYLIWYLSPSCISISSNPHRVLHHTQTFKRHRLVCYFLGTLLLLPSKWEDTPDPVLLPKRANVQTESYCALIGVIRRGEEI